ncbi:hypothetical protein J8N05_45675 [Streptomyces sp. BH-SS-21]|uniref:Uncharacterized protein n=1 Tax=Streptomyces liliiviolaceus TaxID=2823109 RepID=A0A941BD62_9ACTN|nr:hypothetical protein [Streptomyces liliiviolaceus]MBQ0855462.1 hypothetical protein [Streptomyces liliiviolaceus]
MTPDQTPFPAGGEPRPYLDFRVTQLDGDEQISRAFYDAVSVNDDMLDPLAQHHSADDAHSFFVLYDHTATWDHPGEPQFIALHLQRDVQNRTFRFERTVLPLPSMAQSWLIHRGCPSEAIALDPDRGTKPADEATRALQERLMSVGDHYALGWSYTSDDPDDHVTLAVLRARDEHAPSPFRVLVEEVDFDTGTHTLREGGFGTVGEAMDWSRDRLEGAARPLPPVRPRSAHSRPTTAPKSAASRPSVRAP